MVFNQLISNWWRELLEPTGVRESVGIEVLRQRYVEEIQRADRFREHAKNMHYPQHREKLLQFSRDTQDDAGTIGAKLLGLGVALPELVHAERQKQNSWASLTAALDEENRSADRLIDQLVRIEHEQPEISALLQRIFQKQAGQRRDIQGMLMRSDPFFQSLA